MSSDSIFFLAPLPSKSYNAMTFKKGARAHQSPVENCKNQVLVYLQLYQNAKKICGIYADIPKFLQIYQNFLTLGTVYLQLYQNANLVHGISEDIPKIIFVFPTSETYQNWSDGTLDHPNHAPTVFFLLVYLHLYQYGTRSLNCYHVIIFFNLAFSLCLIIDGPF